MLDLGVSKVEPLPFDHIFKNNFISTDLYERLRDSFPACPKNSGPTGHSRFWGDPEYDDLIETNDAWRSFFHAVHSQSFIEYIIAQFGETFQTQGCLVDLSRARYVPYQESRADKERRRIRQPMHPAHELWVRLDLLQGKVGYHRIRHLDHRRRLITLLVYFCDADENQMMGGEVIFHPRRAAGHGAGRLAIKPRHNLMVAFPCSNVSYHSVARIASQRLPRNYVQITVSSSYDAWPTLPTSERAWNLAKIRMSPYIDRVRSVFRLAASAPDSRQA